MSFDDVAKRMRERHQPEMRDAGMPPPPPSPDAFAASLYKSEKRSRAHSNIVLGIVLMVAGIGITAWTHSSAVDSGGGTYVVAYGPIIVGVIKLIRGFVYLGES